MMKIQNMKKNLIECINNKNAYGFVARDENKIVGFAYGYTLLRPDGKQDFYLYLFYFIFLYIWIYR